MQKRLRLKRLNAFAFAFSLSLLLYPNDAGYANTTINSSPANTGNYTLSDAGFITVNANITQTNADGSGGNIGLTAGTVITINNGRTLDVSATLAGRNGGTINLNAPAIIMNGTLRANGMGSGRGGTISLNGTGAAAGNNNYIRIGSTGTIEAQGGNTSALGGVINIIGAGDTWVDIADNARIETTGVAASGANEIYIRGDGSNDSGLRAIDIRGDIIADAPDGSNSSGGLIRFTTTDGDFVSQSTAQIYARGKGTGTGGTLDFLLSEGAQAIDFGNHLTINPSGTIDISGSADGAAQNNGTLRIGRSTLGNMTLDWDEVDPGEFDAGVGTVYVGSFINNLTRNITSRDFDVDNDLNGGAGGAAIEFRARRNIDAALANSSDYGTVRAYSTIGGTVSIYDEDGSNLIIDGISNAGATNIESNMGSVTITNANISGDVTFEVENNLDASAATNTFSGTLAVYDDDGPGVAMGNATIRNNGGLTISRMHATNATVTTVGGGMSLTNTTVSGTTTLSSTGGINGGANSNNFGTSTTATAGSFVNLRD